jgi:integrase/recombinase XerD
MTTLTESLDDYLRLRRNLGYQLADAARLLSRFVAWMDANEQPTVTIAATIAWVETVSADLGSTVWPRRMTAVRGFARYLSGIADAMHLAIERTNSFGHPQRALPTVVGFGFG